MSRRILQILKIINNKTLSYLKDKLPFFNRPLFNVFRKIKFKTDRYKNSFFPRILSRILRTFHLLGHVLSFFRPKNKSIFGVHDPIGLRYLFQLRVRLSPLRSHKGRHNFVDIPSDICHCDQGVENTYHFLFICPTYVTQRATLVTGVNEILLKINLNHLENQFQLYLYGHESISYADNSNILIATLKYIKDTRRFST